MSRPVDDAPGSKAAALVFTFSDDGCVIADRDGTIRAVNDAFLRLFGDNAESYLGHNLDCVFENQTDRRTLIAGAATNPVDIRWIEVAMRRRSGESVTFSVRAITRSNANPRTPATRPQCTADNSPSGYETDVVLIVKDRSLSLHETDRAALMRLTAGLTHDFNNVLAIIKGNVELADMRNAEPRVQQALREAGMGCDMGSRMIQRLMTVGQARHLSPQTIDVAQTIAEFLAMMGIDAKPTGTSSKTLFLSRLDRAEFENVLLNAWRNAIEAMPKGGTITIQLKPVEVEVAMTLANGAVSVGPYLKISITDTGIGMSPGVMARAFEPYYTTKADASGSGLGLAQVYGFVSQSGGGVALASAPGVGTNLTLYIPREGAIEASSASILIDLTFAVNI